MSLHTLDELLRFKNRQALPTWDATLSALLERAPDEALREPADSPEAAGEAPS